jgi:hypothetical protein
MVVHHIPHPPNLWALIALCVAFTLYLVHHHSSILSASLFVCLETELGEALNDKEIYLKSDRGTQLIL